VPRHHIYLADGSRAPRRRGTKKQRPLCRSCGGKYPTAIEAARHRRRVHGPYTYKGFALSVDQAGAWTVHLPGSDQTFESRQLGRDFIDRRLGIRRSVHAVSGGLPSLGKRR